VRELPTGHEVGEGFSHLHVTARVAEVGSGLETSDDSTGVDVVESNEGDDSTGVEGEESAAGGTDQAAAEAVSNSASLEGEHGSVEYRESAEEMPAGKLV